MSSFVIFDPKDNLIFSHCDQQFRQILLQFSNVNGQKDDMLNGYESNDDNDNDDDDEDSDNNVHNWLSVYLTPYVSMFRECNGHNNNDNNDDNDVCCQYRFDQIPDTYVVRKNVNE